MYESYSYDRTKAKFNPDPRQKNFMKKMIISACLLVVAVSSMAQQTTPSPSLTSEAYLKKSGDQKVGAWLLAGAGGAIFLVTIARSGVASISNTAA